MELYQGMQTSDEFEPFLLARTGPPMWQGGRPHGDTILGGVNADPNQYLFHAELSDYEPLLMTCRNKELYTRHFHQFLRACRPDVVHFQHTYPMGYDMVRQVRNSLPDAAILYTLHEFLTICHNGGRMLRTNDELCSEESPRRCHECFPAYPAEAFFLRKRLIQSHLALVDLFLSPSRFLLERFVTWGIPHSKIRHMENGRPEPRPVTEPTGERPRNRLAYFGQLISHKGVQVLLRALKLLADEGGCDVQLWLHGANLDLSEKEYQSEIRELLGPVKSLVTFAGRYRQEELPRLMANVDWVVVPSTWWENSPMVIQEAFLAGRPVICSDIGGMAEHVADEVNGLHFRVSDPRSLARVIRRAVTTPGLWETLRRGIPRIYRLEEQVADLTEIYLQLLDRTALCR